MNLFHWENFDPYLSANSWFVSSRTLKIYRLVVVIYSLIIVIGELLDYGLREHSLAPYGIQNNLECYLCYFTNLSYIGQTIYFTAALFYSIRSNSLEKFSKLHNFLFWILYHTVVHYHIFIVVVYWGLLSKSFIQANNPWYIWLLNVSVHGIDGSPEDVTLRYIGFTIFFIACYFVVYGFHALRDYIGRKCSKKSSGIVVSDPPMSTV
ncbi:40259_t:CDS:2 [Gigaspora margarita]|uniref:40259_t:CDS:1 n=1 Tax=Gigaspora margarita TaxID=4874 RepID=A0ABN7V1S6_GIGMA|nr:40259_t:CDS:2 [Gigaspora margarita]